MRLAVIDLVTVTSRLLVAEVFDNRVHELERHMRITHLGEGLDETGVISEGALVREAKACRDFVEAIDGFQEREEKPVERIVAVATSAMRDAANREEVCRALREVGLEVAVIPGQLEAKLSFLGAVSGFGPGILAGNEPVLNVDVGGGSTEATLGLLGIEKEEPQIIRTRSFDVGCRRVTDRFLLSDPVLPGEIAAARLWVQAEMGGYFEGFKGQPQAMIAVAGTATTVVTVRDEIVGYDPARTHGAAVTIDELEGVLQKLAALDLRQRMACPGLEPQRAPVILGGIIILQVALELAGLDSFFVSETDILHGVALAAAAEGLRGGSRISRFP